MRFSILLLTLIHLSFVSLSQKKHQLKFDLKPGNTYYLLQETIQDINQQVMGTEQSIKNEITMLSSYKILEKNNNKYVIEANFDEFSFKMSSAYASFEFDSEKENEDNIMNQLFSKMVDQSFSMIMTEYGEITGVQGLEKMMSEMFMDIEMPEAQKAQVRQQMEQNFGPEKMKSSLEMITAIYPTHAVSVGGSWNSEYEITSGFGMNISNQWKLVSHQDDIVVIEGVADVSESENSNLGQQFNNMPTQFEFNGEQITNLKLNAETGWIMEGTSEVSVRGNIKIAKNDQIPQDMVIPITIVTTNTYKRANE